MKLSKNKILITGATAGIGKALAEKFLELDNEIIILGRNKDKLDQFAKIDDRLTPFQCDISKLEELDKLTQFIKTEHPDLNILVNNAGLQFNYDFNDEPDLLGKIDYEINVNLLAPLRLIALLLPTLKQNDNASIVNVTSGLALVPKPQAPVYCGTKAGLHIFSKALRYQMDKVKIFEIIPALVDTAMTEGRGKGKISPEELVDEFIKSFKKNRFEINIGKVKLLRLVNRISPRLADKIMKGSSTS